jgi:hypothetical protein
MCGSQSGDYADYFSTLKMEAIKIEISCKMYISIKLPCVTFQVAILNTFRSLHITVWKPSAEIQIFSHRDPYWAPCYS